MKSHIYMLMINGHKVLGEHNMTESEKKDLVWPSNVNEAVLTEKMQIFKNMVNNGATNK